MGTICFSSSSSCSADCEGRERSEVSLSQQTATCYTTTDLALTWEKTTILMRTPSIFHPEQPLEKHLNFLSHELHVRIVRYYSPIITGKDVWVSYNTSNNLNPKGSCHPQGTTGQMTRSQRGYSGHLLGCMAPLPKAAGVLGAGCAALQHGLLRGSGFSRVSADSYKMTVSVLGS